MTPSDDAIPDSTYPALQPPAEFQSQIPDHLLKEASQTDRFLMEQASIMKQAWEWSVKAHLSADRQLRMTNGKVRRAESDLAVLKADKRAIKVSWKTITVIGGVVVAVVSGILSVYQALK